MMKIKRYGNYQSGIKKRHRLVAIILCAILVFTAVGIGIMISVSVSNATGAVSTMTTGDSNNDGGSDNSGSGDSFGDSGSSGSFGDSADAGASGDESADGDLTDGTDGSDTSGDSGSDESASATEPPSIVITKYPEKMSVGATYRITYTLKNTGGKTNVKWESSDTDVATVDSDGLVRAITKGKTEITAELGKAKASVIISVTEKVIKPKSFKVEVREFTADDIVQSKHNLTIGGILNAEVIVEPAGAKLDGKFLWETDKPGIISIKEEGDAGERAVITGAQEGDVILTIRYDGGSEEMGSTSITFTIPADKAPIDTYLLVIFGVIIAIIVIVIVALIAGRRRRRINDERRARAAQKRRAAQRRMQADQAEQERRANEPSFGEYRGGAMDRDPRRNAGYAGGNTRYGEDDMYGYDGADRAPSRNRVRRDSDGRYADSSPDRSSGHSNRRRPQNDRNRGGNSSRSPRRSSGDGGNGYGDRNRDDRSGVSSRYGDTMQGQGGGHPGDDPDQFDRSTRVYGTPAFRRPPLSSGYGEDSVAEKGPGGGIAGDKSDSGGKRFSIDDID